MSIQHLLEKQREQLMSLISEGHEVVVNHEEVDEYKRKVDTFLSTIQQEIVSEFKKKIEEMRKGSGAGRMENMLNEEWDSCIKEISSWLEGGTK